MSAETVAAFDGRLRELVRPWVEDSRLGLEQVTSVEWGTPRG